MPTRYCVVYSYAANKISSPRHRFVVVLCENAFWHIIQYTRRIETAATSTASSASIASVLYQSFSPFGCGGMTEMLRRVNLWWPNAIGHTLKHTQSHPVYWILCRSGGGDGRQRWANKMRRHSSAKWTCSTLMRWCFNALHNAHSQTTYRYIDRGCLNILLTNGQ